MPASEPVNLKVFASAYGVMLFSFIASRLLLQTDLFMLSALGPDATAAFAIPVRVMFIDIIFAMALGPIVLVAIGKEKTLADKFQVMSKAMSFALIMSSLLVVMGLITYPRLIEYLVHTPSIFQMSTDATRWLTYAIPLRLLCFVASMCLFACGQGRWVSLMYIATLILNAGFNWLFMYGFGWGFVGAYAATFVVLLFELIWLLGFAYRIFGNLPFAKFNIEWLRKILSKIKSEWLRLCSWQLEGLVIIFILASQTQWAGVLSLYGVTSEVSAFLVMPLIALMRTFTVQAAPYYASYTCKQIGRLFMPVYLYALSFSVVAAAAFFISLNTLGKHVYHLSDERLQSWWIYGAAIAVLLPLYTLGYLMRGLYHLKEDYQTVTRTEITIVWLIIIPSCYVALTQQRHDWFFVIILTKEVLIYGVLSVLLRRQTHAESKNQRLNQAKDLDQSST